MFALCLRSWKNPTGLVPWTKRLACEEGRTEGNARDQRDKVVQVFVTAHESVSTTSEAMYDALKRRNYVTPTNYLEFVEGYKTLLSEKKRSLADKAGKLRGGLTKLDETTVQVGEMQVWPDLELATLDHVQHGLGLRSCCSGTREC